MEKISKRFPADVTMEVQTFLNDKKIDGELYAYFQGLSYAKDGVTIVYKSSIPAQTKIGQDLGCSARTYQRHRDYLIEKGFLKDCGPYYELPNKEKQFLMIPLKTLQFLNDNLQEHVIKIYTYLGLRWGFKGEDWIFSYEELENHLGVNGNTSATTRRKVKNALECLRRLKLLDFEDITIREGNQTKTKKKLIDFRLTLD